jgi:NAD+ synthase (glutamine-hydrolysing)
LQEIFEIQTTALARRLKHTTQEKRYSVVSGGLDSTLALIVDTRLFQRMGMDEKGNNCSVDARFWNTSRTRSTANKLAVLNSDFRENFDKSSRGAHFRRH